MIFTSSVRAHHCLNVATISAIFVILCDSQVTEMPTILMIGSPAILGREQEISCSISASIDTPETPFPLTWTRSDMPDTTVNSLRTGTMVSSHQVTFTSLIRFNVTFNDHNVNFTCTMANGTSESLKLSVIQLPEDPTISGPEYVNDSESFTWTCRVDGASYAPPRVQWLNNRGMLITLGVNTTFTDYWNEYNVRIFNVTSNLTLSFHLETSKNFGITCRSIHEASKTTKDSPYFKITIEKTQKNLKGDNTSSEMPTVSLTGSPAIIGHEQEISCSISTSSDTSEIPFPLTWTRSDRPNETLNAFSTRTVRINNQVTFVSLIKINVTFSDHDVTFMCTMANGTSRYLKISVIQPPDDPTISGPEYVNDTESHTWMCRVGGASYAPPHIQWFNNRGMPITRGVHTIFTEYRNQFGVRLFNVTSNLTLAFFLETSNIFGMTCRSIHEASKTTKDSPYFKITIEKTRKDFKRENSTSDCGQECTQK